ncbi:MAG TPA: Mut7-C RNAse domain-containing protein [Thermoplasmata archaeon]|nr:Mut7-C RNAse domain-containing protein [Thermoplasmata archaeon]
MGPTADRPPAATPTRWLADEMLGRLARYLRFAGLDTEYVRDATDDAIAARARADGRTLLTRDRALARRVAGSLLLASPSLDEQLRAVWTTFPDLPRVPSFDRCTRCNGRLTEASAGTPRPDGGAPPGPIYVCGSCGHQYWEGSHTARVRERLRAVLGPP